MVWRRRPGTATREMAGRGIGSASNLFGNSLSRAGNAEQSEQHGDDLRGPLRATEDDAFLYAAIDEAITRKPKGHDFIIDRRHQRPALPRHMSVTGG